MLKYHIISAKLSTRATKNTFISVKSGHPILILHEHYCYILKDRTIASIPDNIPRKNGHHTAQSSSQSSFL